MRAELNAVYEDRVGALVQIIKIKDHGEMPVVGRYIRGMRASRDTVAFTKDLRACHKSGKNDRDLIRKVKP